MEVNLQEIQRIKSSKISKLCKACLKTNNNIDLFNYSYQGKFLNEIFELCTNLKVEKQNEDSPKCVCMRCYPHLIASFMFFRKCSDTNDLLNSVVIDGDHNYAQPKSKDSFEIITVDQQKESEEIFFDEDADQNKELIQIINVNEEEYDPHEDNVGNSQENIYLEPQNGIKETETSKYFKCNYCQAEFIKQIFLETHISTYHNTSKEKCPHCDKIVDNLRNYYLISDDQFTCKTCNHLISANDCLLKHLESHVKVVQDSNCSHCGEYVDGLYKKFLVSVDKYVCRLCKEQLSGNDCLLLHIKSHKKPTCTICHKTFFSATTFKKHLLIHRGFKPYSNDLNKTGSNETNIKSNKSEEGFKFCPICNKQLSRNSSMNVHMRTHQNQGPNFKCELCDAEFRNRIGIRDHMRKHTGDTPYICRYCCRSFHNKSSYKEHQTMHEPPGDPIKCSECPKMLRSEKALKRHMISHNKPYLCTECGKSFSFKTQLTGHQNKHKGLKPFKCRFCPNAYYRRNYLKEHELKHQQLEETFQCYFCDKAFSSQEKLSSHLFRHHPEQINDPQVSLINKE